MLKEQSNHRPDMDLIERYATGELSPSEMVFMASHVALCPDTRQQVHMLETLMADQVFGRPVDHESLCDAVMSSINAVPQLAAETGASGALPKPLQQVIQVDLEALPWKTVLPGIEEHVIDPDTAAGKMSLIRLQPGVAVPTHAHRGREMTLVLQGGFSDAAGHYTVGDVCVLNAASKSHQPVADDDGPCICLTLTEAPPRFSGLFGAIVNPFVR